MNKNSLTKLNKLVDDILAGNRTVLIPPGIFYVATSIGLLLIASVFLMGGTLSLFASFITVKQTAAAQLISVFPIVICVLFPSFMLFQGKKQYLKIKFFYIDFIVLYSIISLAWAGITTGTFWMPFIVSCALGLTARLIVRSTPYKLCLEFFYLLKKT